MCKKYCLSGLLLLIVQYGHAQNPEGRLLDTISEKRLEEVRISSFHINDSLLKAPAAISILSVKDLQRGNQTDIATAVNRIPGLYMQSGGLNTNRISIRGIGARTPYGTNKIRAFYGSIPLTSGDSETTIEDIDIENISQVEIIKGPLSGVYGAGLGGAVLITPKLSGTLGNQASVSTVYGSYGLLKNAVNYNYNGENSSLNINYHTLDSDGWRENSAYHRKGITIAGELFRNKNGKLTYFSNYTYLKAYISSSIDKETFASNPKAAAFTWKASKGYESYDSYLGGISYDWKISAKIKNSTSVFINHKESDEPRPFDILLQNTTGYGARSQFSGNQGKLKYIFGLEYFRDHYKGKTFENLYEDNNGNGSLPGFLLTQTKQSRSFYNVFAQLRLPFTKKIEMQAGLNVNKTRFELNNDYPPGTSSSESYSYETIWSPQLSLLFMPGSLLTFYISASRGFSLPSVEETLTAGGTINSDIRPESGYNFEIGQKSWFFNKTLHTEIAVYSMRIHDLLVAKRIGDDQYIGVNAGETLHQGIEFSADYNFRMKTGFVINPYLSASIGKYKFEDFNDSGNDYSGNKLTGVAANKVNAGVLLGYAKIYLSADFRFVDKIPLNDANTTYADAYRLVDLKCGYRFEIIKGLTSHISAGVNNVTDEHYASMILPNAVGFGTSLPRYYYPGMPANIYTNISFVYWF